MTSACLWGRSTGGQAVLMANPESTKSRVESIGVSLFGNASGCVSVTSIQWKQSQEEDSLVTCENIYIIQIIHSPTIIIRKYLYISERSEESGLTGSSSDLQLSSLGKPVPSIASDAFFSPQGLICCAFWESFPLTSYLSGNLLELDRSDVQRTWLEWSFGRVCIVMTSDDAL